MRDVFVNEEYHWLTVAYNAKALQATLTTPQASSIHKQVEIQ
jgi:hypothetical protein